jgi:exopolysaccharide production protein ExoQ
MLAVRPLQARRIEDTMAQKSLLKMLIGGVERTLVLIIWLIFIMSLFSPWEDYISHQEFSIATGSSQQNFGVSHPIMMAMYFFTFALSLMNLRGVFRMMWHAWPIVILCGWILLSARWAPEPAVSFNRAGHFMFDFLFCCYLTSRYSTEEFVNLATKGFAISVGASLAAMVLAPDLGYYAGAGDYGNAWRGAFVHKNALGAAMAFGTIVSGYSYFFRANHRLLSAATFLGCLFLLVMSRSATAVIATAIASLVAITAWAVESRQRTTVFRTLALGGLTIVVFVLIVGLPLLDLNLNALSGIAGRSGTLTGRTDVWRAVWAAIRERPYFGYGYAFWDQSSVARSNIWLSLGWAPPHSHNNWLDAYLQLGVVGLGLCVFIWFTAIRRVMWLVFVRYGHGALLYLTILFACLAQSVSETIMFSPGIGSLFWIVISYIYIARVTQERLAIAKLSKNERSRVARDSEDTVISDVLA